mgnify:CR=1 FL=1
MEAFTLKASWSLNGSEQERRSRRSGPCSSRSRDFPQWPKLMDWYSAPSTKEGHGMTPESSSAALVLLDIRGARGAGASLAARARRGPRSPMPRRHSRLTPDISMHNFLPMDAGEDRDQAPICRSAQGRGAAFVQTMVDVASTLSRTPSLPVGAGGQAPLRKRGFGLDPLWYPPKSGGPRAWKAASKGRSTASTSRSSWSCHGRGCEAAGSGGCPG